MTAPARWRDALAAEGTLLDVRALTVKQPWAWAIMYGGKTIENRTAAWSYRGPLLIHAGSAWSKRGALDPRVRDAWHRGDPAAREWDLPLPAPVRLTPSVLMPGGPVAPSDPGYDETRVTWFGGILGIADLVDIHRAGECVDPGGPCHPWGETSYVEAGGAQRNEVTHLVLDDVLPFTRDLPDCPGKLGLWHPRPDTLAHVIDTIHDTLENTTP